MKFLSLKDKIKKLNNQNQLIDKELEYLEYEINNINKIFRDLNG